MKIRLLVARTSPLGQVPAPEIRDERCGTTGERNGCKYLTRVIFRY